LRDKDDAAGSGRATLLQKTSMDANSNPLADNNCHKSGQFAPFTRSPKEGANAATTFVVDYARSFMPPFPMKEFPVSTRYTAEELKQLDATAKQCKISRAELIHARSLRKIITTHELADWAE
jgi:hypothetical protein